MNYLVTILVIIFSLNAWGDCPEFATALEAAMARVSAREAKKSIGQEISKVEFAATEKAATLKWSGSSAQKFKAKYGNESLVDFNNRSYMNLMEMDKKSKSTGALYFDVENAVQKKLNDSLIGDKGMVDAVNNAFMGKFMANIKESPEVMKALEGSYKDYKSIRLRLNVKPENAAEMEAKLSAIYQKTNREFVAEFESEGLTKLLPPRTDEVPDVSTWFLSGTGESALEANMAARGARNASYGQGNAKTMSFTEQVESMHADVSSIEKIRERLASDSDLLKSGIMKASSDGAVIPTKEMIGILRKIKPADCENAAEYALKIREKTKTIFGANITDKQIDDLTIYFQKVDSISPPLFQRDRIAINLDEARGGIVSIDFAGVGVDNAYEQMKALSIVNYAQADKQKLLKDAFVKIQSNVDNVTSDMNNSKKLFTAVTKDAADSKIKPKFSGDDGILMPKNNWTSEQKITLVKKLSQSSDPSKFRVTFVKTELSNGGILPAAERSQRVVRAEGIEKFIRESVVGVNKISNEKSKKMIFAIDYIPDTRGGKFNLLIGGAKPTDNEKKIIAEAFKRALSSKDQEKIGELIEAFN